MVRFKSAQCTVMSPKMHEMKGSKRYLALHGNGFVCPTYFMCDVIVDHAIERFFFSL